MKKLLLLISSLFITNFIMAQCVAITGFTVTPPTCFAQANGAVVVTYSAGLAPYVISVIGSSTQTFTTSTLSQSIFGLPADSYNIIITDNNGCQSSQSVNVVEPLPLLTSYNSSPATCGLANGSVTLTIFGGTPSYNVVWNLPWSPTGSMQTNMPSGVWTASVTDAQGCILQQTVSIANPPFPSITSFSTTSPGCFGLSNGVLTVNYTAGTAPYTINWSSPISQTITTAALSQSVSGIASGVYSATVTDSYGCSSSQPVNVNQPGLLVLMSSLNQTICAGQSTQIFASGSGGTPPYSYSWTPNTLIGGGPHSVTPTTTTNYTVSLQDVNGCAPSLKIITVNVTPPLAVVGSAITICDGASTVLAPIIVSQGNGGPYTYSWSTSEATSSITVIGNAPSGPTATSYTLVVDDGCTMPGAMTVFTVNANVCTGIQELNNSNVSFYPNPTNGLVRIESIELIQGIEVMDITGQILLSETATEKTHQLQLQNYAEGIYFVRVVYPNGLSAVKKVIVNN